MAIANTQVKQANRPQVSLTGRKTISPFSIFHLPNSLSFFFCGCCARNSPLTATILRFIKLFQWLRVAAVVSFWVSCLPKTSAYLPPSASLSLSLTPVCQAYSCFPLFCLHLNWKLVFGHFNMARLLIYHATFPFLFCFFLGFSSFCFSFSFLALVECLFRPQRGDFLKFSVILFMTCLIGFPSSAAQTVLATGTCRGSQHDAASYCCCRFCCCHMTQLRPLTQFGYFTMLPHWR